MTPFPVHAPFFHCLGWQPEDPAFEPYDHERAELLDRIERLHMADVRPFPMHSVLLRSYSRTTAE
jgi:hypothetical protein